MKFWPRRREGDKLQIISVANFKGGSAKTTTSLYLAQGLALQGYRVLAIDLDPAGLAVSDVRLPAGIRHRRKRHPLRRDPLRRRARRLCDR